MKRHRPLFRCSAVPFWGGQNSLRLPPDCVSAAAGGNKVQTRFLGSKLTSLCPLSATKPISLSSQATKMSAQSW